MDDAARRELDEGIALLLARLADGVADDARRLAPVRTGHLRSSIATGPIEGNTVRVSATADYAAYVELGTRYMAAQPFLKPALYRKRDV